MTKKRRLITIILVCALLLAVSVLGAAGYRKWSTEQTLRGVQTMYELYNLKYPSFRFSSTADYAQFDYSELWREAHTIALVTPEDVLSEENSRGITASGDRFYDAHSVRTVRALRFFKNEHGYPESFSMVEECAMLEDGSVVGMDECYPMQKGDVYLVFLGSSGWNKPIVISADNGKFDLTNLRLNNAYRQPLIVGALMDMDLLAKPAAPGEALERFPAAEYLTDSSCGEA